MNTMRPVYSYIEVPEGQTINDINGLNSVTMTKDQYDEVNERSNILTGKFGAKGVEELIDQLEVDRGVIVDLDVDVRPNPETWVRPQDWPNLDSLGLLDDGTQDDYIYMTYDANAEISAVALHIEKITNGTDITCTLGHITNGEYVPDETITGNSNNYLYWFDGQYPYDYPVVRVTGDIKCCYTYTVTNSNSQQLNFRQQKILERIAYIPHATQLANSTSNGWGTFSLKRDKVSNGDGTALTTLYYAWSYCRELLSLDISHLYTPNTTNIACAFIQCYRLSGTMDLRHWSVAKVTAMNSMFSYCLNLDYINLTGWNTEKVSNISNMFEYCHKLKIVYGIEDFKTNLCTSFAGLFLDNLYLRALDLSKWNTEKLTGLNSTFYNCFTLKTLNVSTWDTSKVTNINGTFYYCYSLQDLDLSSWSIPLVTNFANTFNGCKSLRRLNLNHWTSNDKITTIGNAFSNCNNLEELYIENIILTSKCTMIYQLFYNCFRLKQLDLNPNWDLSGLSNSSSQASGVFQNCYSLKKITGTKNWKFYFTNAFTSVFANCWSLEEVDVSGWKVDTITSFANMFDYCYSLKVIDVSGWTPTASTSFSAMFRYCLHLKTIDISTWVAPNCTSYANMFDNCRSLVSCGDLSNLNTSKVTTTQSMFAGCWSLTSLTGLSNWDMQKVTNISYMFQYCEALKSLSISNWNLAACTTIAYTFAHMRNLETLDLYNWSIPKVATVTQCFYYLYNLKTIVHTLPLAIAHTYTHCENISHQSVLNIISALPTVSKSTTVTINAMANNQLTAAERAVATAKGWTVAA